ncbi:substrate-binding domain-containing protein [Catenovulum sp. 2E275]|uniref:AraC family transcriptional regulator n=1 Tax=Catenovulum sp. 2E275 TaxID=2980497 RepID=UPI0021D36894|nr:substrate-binding domain-containing protein [Catenovulum sp. 2E275]MCU4675312.1 substrate-binding domain-containing protein [Catenovulum sp. 2E275]
MKKESYSVTLLLNANKAFDRQIIEGVGRYLQSSKVNWDLYLEEDFRWREEQINNWYGDGIIADFDDPRLSQVLTSSKFRAKLPIVGVGGSYANPAHYPDIPYIATDNYALVEAAYNHLKKRGFTRFAFYGFPDEYVYHWASEREKAMVKLAKQDEFPCKVIKGLLTKSDTWKVSMDYLVQILKRLEHPCGIVAATDSRARHLLSACEKAGIFVPDQVSIIGIDDDDVVRSLSRTSLSSVRQNGTEIGYLAAKNLDILLRGHSIQKKVELVSPSAVIGRDSTDFKAVKDPHVIQAVHFIRNNAFHGIKVEQVCDFVGVSRSNLEQRFTEERGHTLHIEIHNVKINKACDLLRHTDMDVNTISRVCGYPSLQYMYTLFKKHFETTPTAYRKKYKAIEN